MGTKQSLVLLSIVVKLVLVTFSIILRRSKSLMNHGMVQNVEWECRGKNHHILFQLLIATAQLRRSEAITANFFFIKVGKKKETKFEF